MVRSDVEQIDVLEAVVTQLQSVLDLSDRQCYEVARFEDVPSIPVGGDYWLTVAPGDGTFEPEEQVNGNVTEYSDVVVSAYTRIKTDSTNHDKHLLTNDTRGLLRIKKWLLGALCGQDLATTAGATFLRQLCFAKSATRPDLVTPQNADREFGVIRVTFGTNFDWQIQ